MKKIVLTSENAETDTKGYAVIPNNTYEIGRKAFKGNKDLKKVVLPDSVEVISEEAFAECENLEEVEFGKNVKSIFESAFRECQALKYAVLPDGLEGFGKGVFYGAGLCKPVYNESGEILFYYPPNLTDTSYTMPSSVKLIFCWAFMYCPHLKEINLNEGLENIDSYAFGLYSSDVTNIKIPKSVREIYDSAFYGCKKLKKVEIMCEDGALSFGAFKRCPEARFIENGMETDFERELYIKGEYLEEEVKNLKVPETRFLSDIKFREYSSRCAYGDTSAMMEMGEYFENLGEDTFYNFAANFWRYRAYKFGDKRGKEWKDKWLAEHPRQKIPCKIEKARNFTFDGKILNSLGFTFFEPERRYCIEKADKNGIILVSSLESDDGPDEYGFGYEEYDDYWYLDVYLKQIEGTRKINSSSRSKDKEIFEKEYKKACQALKYQNKYI